MLLPFYFCLIISGQVNYQETDGEGITHITVVVDIAGAVLADSISGAYFVADCLAFVDSVSYCWYCRRGVPCAAQGHFIFAREITRPSLMTTPPLRHQDTKFFLCALVLKNSDTKQSEGPVSETCK